MAASLAARKKNIGIKGQGRKGRALDWNGMERPGMDVGGYREERGHKRKGRGQEGKEVIEREENSS